jgi:type II secretory ATPase GspE/PulE/Tfp pilus assembly ATPase PilB-like protein
MPELDDLGQPAALSLDIQSGNESVDSRLNIDQMLSLIDSILPFEACLFYQVIPLSIESGHLNLGMVNPGDAAAMDYVRRQVSYIKYSVASLPVSSDWHRQMLSQYLSYAAKVKQRKKNIRSGETPAWPTTTERAQANNADDQLTFVVDSPEEITLVKRFADTRPEVGSPEVAKQGTQPLSKTFEMATPGQAADPPLQLEFDDNYGNRTLADLRHLPPKPLMQALLYRVLTQGIGRLYFERQPTVGRVLCSQDGVLQSVLEDLSLDLFQSVINELKRLTHLPLLPTTKTRQVEIERLYQQERILLRLRLIAGTHGEEATLQVLRGAALKFYQQQQIEQLGRDALGIAQTLQKRITSIRDQTRQSLNLETTSTATLLAVNNLLKDMESQIDQLLYPQKPDRD